MSRPVALLVSVFFIAGLAALVWILGADTALRKIVLPSSSLAAGPAGEAGPIQRGPAEPRLDLRILVDQFGYRPQDHKLAVIRSARVGFDVGQAFDSGQLIELRRVSDDEVILSAPPAAWNGGAVQASSGDVGWWFDFSEVTTPGEYYVHDRDNNRRSAVFPIGADVYSEALKAAVRMYFYQRCGFAKQAPHAQACWTDEAAYLRKGQDMQARDVRFKDDPASERDLSGGWFDAGDTNKYVTFASQAVHQLLMAYQNHPNVFTDDFNIPESGNGIPDLLDEVRWEMNWLRKMQNHDGSVLLKVGVLEHKTASPPSSDKLPRYYVGACTSSTIAAAAMYAHAAHVFSGFPALKGDAADLSQRAAKAFAAYLAAPEKQEDCDSGEVLSGDADRDADTQDGFAAMAAIYLFAVSGEGRYHDYLKKHYRDLWPYKLQGWSTYNPQMGEALLYYAQLPNADKALRETILADKLEDARSNSDIYGDGADDLYRNPLRGEQYHWGSNSVRASYANTNIDMLVYDIDEAKAAQYKGRALDTLHYFHGVNPFGIVYLSNMYEQGATYAANEIFHQWYAHGTRFSNARLSECGPAPGYFVGGPNANAQSDGVPQDIQPPVNQPPQKAYRDWNTPWPDASYTVTEPSIVYQSNYVKALAAFAR